MMNAFKWPQSLEEGYEGLTIGLGETEYREPFDEKTYLKMPVNALINLGKRRQI